MESATFIQMNLQMEVGSAMFTYTWEKLALWAFLFFLSFFFKAVIVTRVEDWERVCFKAKSSDVFLNVIDYFWCVNLTKY